MSDELKPCAHCGGVAKIDLEDRCVECAACPMMTVPVGDGPLADAVTAWNRRADSGWVAVGDRLPIIGESVLIWEQWSDTPFVGGLRLDSTWFADKEHYEAGGDGWLEDNVDPKLITHWRPLPPPPDKESQ